MTARARRRRKRTIATLVSMVLNKRGDENGISKTTQAKVWEKAKELNYKPNKFARGLRMGNRGHGFGVLVIERDLRAACSAQLLTSRNVRAIGSRIGDGLCLRGRHQKGRVRREDRMQMRRFPAFLERGETLVCTA